MSEVWVVLTGWRQRLIAHRIPQVQYRQTYTHRHHPLLRPGPKASLQLTFSYDITVKTERVVRLEKRGGLLWAKGKLCQGQRQLYNGIITVARQHRFRTTATGGYCRPVSTQCFNPERQCGTVAELTTVKGQQYKIWRGKNKVLSYRDDCQADKAERTNEENLAAPLLVARPVKKKESNDEHSTECTVPIAVL